MRRILFQLLQLNNELLPVLRKWNKEHSNLPIPETEQEWLTQLQAAEFVGESISSIRRHTRSGHVQSTSKGRGGRYSKTELIRYRKEYYKR